jgi:hypothetical protein
MSQHDFLFHPGYWIGEGKITFSVSSEHLRNYTRWIVSPESKEGIQCKQTVEMQGGSDNVNNAFFLHGITATGFKINLENELVGTVKGTGVIDAKTIAWEFRGNGGIEGFEVYELQDNGDYMIHAEYSSPDQFRTIIDGRIWKKSDSPFPEE